MTPLQQFQTLLAGLFQLDYADLDFGIYRLFKLKEREVRAFINEDLPRAVDAAFGAAHTAEATRAELEALRAEIVGALDDDAVNADGTLNDAYAGTRIVKDRAERYTALRATLAAGARAEGSRADAFNHLLAFFSRYYEAGDFLPRRRYGRTETYAAPYDGQEVLFHWPTRGMHYIKSAEHFRDYAFTVEAGEGLRVRFALSDADLPRDNAKGDARFFFALPDQAAFAPGEDGADGGPSVGTLTVPFHYRPATAADGAPKQDDLLDAAHGPILAAIAAHAPFAAEALRAAVDPGARPGQASGTTLLAKRLRHFARRHTTDYFLSPDLGPFLRRELAFYLKDQVLHLDDLSAGTGGGGDFDARRRLIRVVRDVGERVIAFLDGIEQVQVRLFRKPKLVLRADALVPIVHVPEALWDEILASAGQRAAWAHLFGTPADADDGRPGVDADFLRSHPTLVVDTAHFDAAFRWRLLAALPFESLDEATDGVLVHAENYQALTALRPRFEGEVQTVYIDPPYNTGGDGFIYKDRYQHASWLTFVAERLALAREMMPDDAALFVSIDDDEAARLKAVCDEAFGPEQFVASAIWQKKYAPANDAKWFSDDHDYVMVYAKDREAWHPRKLPRTEKQDKAYTNPDNDPRGPWKAGDYTSNKSKEERPNGWYAITNPNTGQEIWPSEKAVWRYPAKTHKVYAKEKRVWWGMDGTNSVPAYKRFLDEMGGVVPKTIWPYTEVGHNQDAVRDLQGYFGVNPFPSPKPVKLLRRVLQLTSGTVLDFLAGSGTTADATIQANRDDDTRRRFILAEMGSHFDTVLLPRIQKAMYAPAWKDGRPAEEPVFAGLLGAEALPAWVARTPRLVRVLRLESYDDAVHNLAATAAPAANGAATPVTRRAEAVEKIVGADAYRLRYLFALPLDAAQTALAAGPLVRPFALTLETLTESGPVARPIDLAETAATLLGLRVHRVREHDVDGRRHLALFGRERGGAPVAVVLRDLEDAAGQAVDAGADRAALDVVLAGLAPGTRVLVNGGSAHPAAEALDVALAAALAPVAA